MSKRKDKAQQYAIFFYRLQQLDKRWVSECRFHDERMWRFDFAFPPGKLAIEVDGGIWTAGRHSGGQGQIDDMEKMNNAVALGWQVLHFTPQQVNGPEAFRFLHWVWMKNMPIKLTVD
jgi:very-short-patch-repair endonuclease